MSNEAVARALLAKGLSTMQACVYLDDKDQKVVLVRGSDKPVGAAHTGATMLRGGSVCITCLCVNVRPQGLL